MLKIEIYIINALKEFCQKYREQVFCRTHFCGNFWASNDSYFFLEIWPIWVSTLQFCTFLKFLHWYFLRAFNLHGICLYIFTIQDWLFSRNTCQWLLSFRCYYCFCKAHSYVIDFHNSDLFKLLARTAAMNFLELLFQ